MCNPSDHDPYGPESYIKVHKSSYAIWRAVVWQAWFIIDNQIDETEQDAPIFGDLAATAALLNDVVMRMDRYVKHE